MNNKLKTSRTRTGKTTTRTSTKFECISIGNDMSVFVCASEVTNVPLVGKWDSFP